MHRLLRRFFDAAAFAGFDIHRAATLRRLPQWVRHASDYRRAADAQFPLAAPDADPPSFTQTRSACRLIEFTPL